MLTFSRGQRGDPRPLSLGRSIEESVSLLCSTLPSTLELRTSVAADAPLVLLAVQDDGIGIEPAVLERMSEPFFSTRDVGKGTGMGLATVHGIVHERGGHVLVESMPGRGTTFRVLFPVHLLAPGGQAHRERDVNAGAARAVLSGHVLVVDDEEMVIELMRGLLEG